jgi:hypothetical protein
LNWEQPVKKDWITVGRRPDRRQREADNKVLVFGRS